MKNPTTLATEFNNSFIKSTTDISKLFPPPKCDFCPIDHTQPVFSINMVREFEVNNIIYELNNSKAKDEYELDFLKIHKDSLVYTTN